MASPAGVRQQREGYTEHLLRIKPISLYGQNNRYFKRNIAHAVTTSQQYERNVTALQLDSDVRTVKNNFFTQFPVRIKFDEIVRFSDRKFSTTTFALPCIDGLEVDHWNSFFLS